MPENFWPQSLLGWLAVAGVAVSVATAVWAFSKNISKLNGYGARLNNQELATKGLDTRVSGLERSVEMSGIDRTNLHESVSRITTEMQTLMSLTRDVQMARLSDLGEIKERLVRIETKVSVRNGDDG